jgi:hypothetical protein
MLQLESLAELISTSLRALKARKLWFEAGSISWIGINDTLGDVLASLTQGSMKDFFHMP